MTERSTRRTRVGALLTALALVVGALVAMNAVPASAVDETVVRAPLADATIQQGTPNTNFGSATALLVDNSPVYRFLMRFDVSVPAGKTLKSAVLTLSCVSSSPNAGSIRLLSGGWTESGVTWNTAPAFGEQVASMGQVVKDQSYQVDLTAAAQGRTTLEIGWIGGSNDGADFVSKEGTASRRPTLTLVFSDTTTPDPSPTATVGPSASPTVDPDPSPSPTADPDPSPSPTATAEPGPDVTETRQVLADATIQQSTPSTNFGSATTLLVDNSPVLRFLVRADVSVPAGKVVKSARLMLSCLNSSSSGGSVRLLSGSWSEGTVNWNNAPTFGTTVATMGRVSSGTRYAVDVTAAAQGRTTLDIGWVGTTTDGADFASRNHGTASLRPTLVIVWGDPGTPTPSPTQTTSPSPTTDPEPGESFDVGLIGDVPYSSAAEVDFLDLRDTMNAANLAYVVHVGDIKSGSSACTDSLYTGRRTMFNGFSAPFVYTPGDNEWSDCDGEELDRLEYLRGVFFPDNLTMGIRKETVVRQPGYPENARWSRGGIMFATVHTVGGSDFEGAERDARRVANVAWIHAAFDAADAAGSRGVVILTQANWGEPYGTSRTAFTAVKDALHEEVLASSRPVVFVHGDTHQFRIDKPLEDSSGNTVEHFTRIEVHAGADDWVRLRVVDGPEVFQATSLPR